MVLFHFIWVNGKIAFRDVLVPVRFFSHSLLNLLGPAELREFIKSHVRIFSSHTKHRPMYTIVLTQSSGPTPSGSLEIDSGRLNLPMSHHPSLNALLSYLS